MGPLRQVPAQVPGELCLPGAPHPMGWGWGSPRIWHQVGKGPQASWEDSGMRHGKVSVASNCSQSIPAHKGSMAQLR